MTKPERPQTREEFLRELVPTHQFVIVDKGNQTAEGYIVQVINPEVVLVDIWRNGDRNTITMHYIQFKDMGWDEFTQTGFVFDRLPEPP